MNDKIVFELSFFIARLGTLTFLQQSLNGLNSIKIEVTQEGTFVIFRKHLLNFIRTEANNVFNVHNIKRIKLLSRLRVDFSHLKEH